MLCKIFSISIHIFDFEKKMLKVRNLMEIGLMELKIQSIILLIGRDE